MKIITMLLVTLLLLTNADGSDLEQPEQSGDSKLLYKALLYSTSTNRFFRQVINQEKKIFNIEHCILVQGSVQFPGVKLKTSLLEGPVPENRYQYVCALISPYWVDFNLVGVTKFNQSVDEQFAAYLREQEMERTTSTADEAGKSVVSWLAGIAAGVATFVYGKNLKTRLLGSLISSSIIGWGIYKGYSYSQLKTADKELSSLEFAMAISDHTKSSGGSGPKLDVQGWPKSDKITPAQGNYLMDAVFFAFKIALTKNGVIENY